MIPLIYTTVSKSYFPLFQRFNIPPILHPVYITKRIIHEYFMVWDAIYNYAVNNEKNMNTDIMQ